MTQNKDAKVTIGCAPLALVMLILIAAAAAVAAVVFTLVVRGLT